MENNAIKKLIADSAMHVIETDNWDSFNDRPLILYDKTDTGIEEVRKALGVATEYMSDKLLDYFLDRFLAVQGKHLIKLLESDLPRGDLIKMFAAACHDSLLHVIMHADHIVKKLHDERSISTLN